MGAPTSSLAAAWWQIRSGGSLTRYLGNLYRTLGAVPGTVQVGHRIKTHSYASSTVCHRIFFAGDRPGALPLGQEQVYSFAMIQLPASYQEYLARQDQHVIDTVRPVLMQSAADQRHGVRVIYNTGSTGHQAHLDDTIPYGTIVEDID